MANDKEVNEEIKEEEKKLKVVTGDSSNLDVSKVFEHLNAVKPKTKDKKEKKEEIIIPEVKKKK